MVVIAYPLDVHNSSCVCICYGLSICSSKIHVESFSWCVQATGWMMLGIFLNHSQSYILGQGLSLKYGVHHLSWSS